MNFFVLGLPRSRTCWLANFLTYDRHYCFHEGMNTCKSLSEYKEKLGTDFGDSSTATMLFDINREFPDAPKIIIESDIQRSIDYAVKTLGLKDPNYIVYMQQQLDKVSGPRVHFDDIDYQLPFIWHTLIGTPFDERRSNIVKTMNIQMQNIGMMDIDSLNQFFSTV